MFASYEYLHLMFVVLLFLIFETVLRHFFYAASVDFGFFEVNDIRDESSNYTGITKVIILRLIYFTKN